MMNFLDLQRRFRDLRDAELEDTELLVPLNEDEFGLSVAPTAFGGFASGS